jgi:hypothetical protein
MLSSNSLEKLASRLSLSMTSEGFVFPSLVRVSISDQFGPRLSGSYSSMLRSIG